MKYHSQNLNESRAGEVAGSILWHGRAWLHKRGYRKFLHWEWCFGKFSRSFRWTITFGNGENNNGVLLSLGVPWLFTLYLCIDGMWTTKEQEAGIAVHSNALWIYTFSWCNEWSKSDPWWRKGFSWSFPWDWDWYQIEIMEHKSPNSARAVHVDQTGHRLGEPFDRMRTKDKAAASVSEAYPYSYVRKSGEVQNRIATVYVERMTWRMKWWWLLPFKRCRTSININFSDEVGEETGSWKGGCTGCSYHIAQHETPLDCLRRMELERKF